MAAQYYSDRLCKSERRSVTFPDIVKLPQKNQIKTNPELIIA